MECVSSLLELKASSAHTYANTSNEPGGREILLRQCNMKAKDKVTTHEVFGDNYSFCSLYISATAKLNQSIPLEMPLRCTNVLNARICQYLCTFQLFNLDFCLKGRIKGEAALTS